MNRTLNQLRQPKSTPSLRTTALLLSLIASLNSQITACAGDKFEPAQPKVEGFSGGGGKAGSETTGNGGNAGTETAGGGGKAGSETGGNGGQAGSETSGNGGQAGTENSGNGGEAGSETAGSAGKAGSKTGGNGGQAGTENSGNGGEAGSETAGSAGSTPETCNDPKIGKICAEAKGVCAQTKYIWTCQNNVYKCAPETPLAELSGYSTQEICGDNLDNNCDGKGDLQNDKCEKPQIGYVALSTIKTTLLLVEADGKTSSNSSLVVTSPLNETTVYPQTFVASGNNGIKAEIDETCGKFGENWKPESVSTICKTVDPNQLQQNFCLKLVYDEFNSCTIKPSDTNKCQSSSGSTFTLLPNNQCSVAGTPAHLITVLK